MSMKYDINAFVCKALKLEVAVKIRASALWPPLPSFENIINYSRELHLNAWKRPRQHINDIVMIVMYSE